MAVEEPQQRTQVLLEECRARVTVSRRRTSGTAGIPRRPPVVAGVDEEELLRGSLARPSPRVDPRSGEEVVEADEVEGGNPPLSLDLGCVDRSPDPSVEEVGSDPVEHLGGDVGERTDRPVDGADAVEESFVEEGLEHPRDSHLKAEDSIGEQPWGIGCRHSWRHRRQSRMTARRCRPLGVSVVRIAEHADRAARPVLTGDPLKGVVPVVDLVDEGGELSP
ncbi:Uncharacterised protein [Mycobacteroides abscessus subsp. abscessus]|nr:Uncharacterised protein [Mycobacteroides abscessus subsp. abscessus]